MTTDQLPIATPAWMDAQSTGRGAVNINDIYWKRGPNEEHAGWILIGPSAEIGANGRPLTLQAEAWIRKGRVPLVQYSYTNRTYKNGERHTIETSADRLHTEWRWYWLFKNGGAHLFPIDQIVAYKWHIKPPYDLPKSVFPQLDEWDVPDPLWCAACPGTRAPKNSVEELVTHAMIAHRMTEPQARDLLKYASEPPVGPSGLNIRRKAAKIEQKAEAEGVFPMEMPSPEAPAQPTKHICNFCGDEFPKGLAMHMKWCKARPQGTSGDPGEQVNDAPDTEVENAEASLRTGA